MGIEFTIKACVGGKTDASNCVTSDTVFLNVKSCSNYVLSVVWRKEASGEQGGFVLAVCRSWAASQIPCTPKEWKGEAFL